MASLHGLVRPCRRCLNNARQKEPKRRNAMRSANATATGKPKGADGDENEQYSGYSHSVEYKWVSDARNL